MGKLQLAKTPFGTVDGNPVDLYTLSNDNGMTVKITNYGGIVTELSVPDREGNVADVVLGFDSVQPYVDGHPYFGAIIGRYGNRIRRGRFSLDEKDYALAQNNGENNLHGGERGFDKRIFSCAEFREEGKAGISLSYSSADGEEGFPGNLDVVVTYAITENNELLIGYRAKTDAPTIVNLTHHSYFNLAGEGSGTILGHEVAIDSDAFTPIDETLITTGEIRKVEGTVFDFRKPATIGSRIKEKDDQLSFAGGFDHNWVLNSRAAENPAASAYDPSSGRLMEVFTVEPGMQFYSGNFLDGSLVGKSGKKYEYRSGFCMETQHYPDSPNKPEWPSVVLRPGEAYSTSTAYRFSVKK